MDDTTIRHDTTERHRAKYENSNPLHQVALGHFFDRVTANIRLIEPESTLEFGCGEGFLLRELRARGASLPDFVGLDLRADALQTARALHPDDTFLEVDLLEWTSDQTFELVLVSQVMEHLPDPDRFMAPLAARCTGHLLFTVPHEPFFQLINLARGRDLRRLGNHPEHVNRWSKDGFAEFVGRHFEVVNCESSFPFTICVAKP